MSEQRWLWSADGTVRRWDLGNRSGPFVKTPAGPMFHSESPAEDCAYLNALEAENTALKARAALADDAYGWAEWVHTASSSIQIQRMTTEWLARYDELTKEETP